MSKITDLANKYAELSKQHKEASAVVKTIGDEWTQVENDLLDAFVEEGVASVKLEGVANFSMSTKHYLSVTKANFPTMLAYLKESGSADLIQETVPEKTLGAFLDMRLKELINKTMLEDNVDEVEARAKALQVLTEKGASTFTKRTVSMRKAT